VDSTGKVTDGWPGTGLEWNGFSIPRADSNIGDAASDMNARVATYFSGRFLLGLPLPISVQNHRHRVSNSN
jgi:hypothetical protein